MDKERMPKLETPKQETEMPEELKDAAAEVIGVDEMNPGQEARFLEVMSGKIELTPEQKKEFLEKMKEKGGRLGKEIAPWLGFAACLTIAGIGIKEIIQGLKLNLGALTEDQFRESSNLIAGGFTKGLLAITLLLLEQRFMEKGVYPTGRTIGGGLGKLAGHIAVDVGKTVSAGRKTFHRLRSFSQAET
jgi:hypothetical protein